MFFIQKPQDAERHIKNRTAILLEVSKKSWVTHTLVPINSFLKEFIERQHATFKIFILIDNARDYPQTLKNTDENVKIQFHLSILYSLIQPLDLSMIQALKSYYLHKSFQKFIQELA